MSWWHVAKSSRGPLPCGQHGVPGLGVISGLDCRGSHGGVDSLTTWTAVASRPDAVVVMMHPTGDDRACGAWVRTGDNAGVPGGWMAVGTGAALRRADAWVSAAGGAPCPHAAGCREVNKCVDCDCSHAHWLVVPTMVSSGVPESSAHCGSSMPMGARARCLRDAGMSIVAAAVGSAMRRETG